MDDFALRYEYLIRSAFQCGRYGVPGANADTFRALERSFVLSRDNTDAARKEDLLFNYAFDCGEVATYIITAIEKFAKDFDQQLNPAQNQEIEDITMLLDNSDIIKIEEAIERSEALMVAFGRYPTHS
ncbi:hypothetical protein [Flavobacterium sp. LB2P44]|uniref:hypothetical protein n=1 Tax=Flavobacterium sp. LB2P44 TaxID=3401713 RepID=UPI003AAC9DE5